MISTHSAGAAPQSAGLRAYFGKIYSKMALGVFVSGIISFTLVHTVAGFEILQVISSSNIYYYGLFAVQLGLLFGIQWGINKLSRLWAEILFYIYAITIGVTLSGLLLAYANATIVSAFVGAIAVFAALAYFGKTTKYDMSGWRVFLYTGMWGVFISSVVNIFLSSNTLDWVVTIVGVLVFSGLTVYDAQTYKKIYENNPSEDHGKIIIMGALHMYINFIMIFQSLLKIIGRD